MAKLKQVFMDEVKVGDKVYFNASGAQFEIMEVTADTVKVLRIASGELKSIPYNPDQLVVR